MESVIKNQAALQKAVFRSEMLSSKAKLDEKKLFESIKALVVDGHFWHKAYMLQQLLRPFLKVTVALESNSPKLSHVYANMAFLMREAVVSELVPTEKIKPLLKKRFASAYHPLMGIAYLADPIQRLKRPVAVPQSQLSYIGCWLRDFWFEGNAQKAGRVYGQLQNLRGRTGPFADDVKWYSSMSMAPVDWWSQFKEEEPDLVEICVLALSIAPTTGAAERNWSAHGYIHSQKRNTLDHATVQKLVFVYFNIRIKMPGKIAEEDLEEPFDLDLDDQISYEPDYVNCQAVDAVEIAEY